MAADNVTTWATAISTHAGNGRKIIFRYASALDPRFQRRSQSIRIILVWQFQSDSGLPQTNERERMDQMEDTLEPAFCQDGFATLAIVSTGENLREWTYYAKSEEEFMARLNLALAGIAPYPIEIYITDDPDWSMYEEFRRGVKDPSPPPAL